MKAADFVSAPDDLLPAVLEYGQKLEDDGWRVKIEPWDLAFPRTPLFLARRGHTTWLFEVQSSIDLATLREWARYCRTCTADTRICVGLVSTMPTPEQLDEARNIGIGIYMRGKTGPYELMPPQDIAMQFELPEVPRQLRPLLGDAYGLFDKGLWREGFEAACTMLEQEARTYLKRHVQQGRITFVGPTGRPKSYSSARIGTMTIGALAVAFSEIQTPNLADTRIAQSLSRVNLDRITAAHFKGKDATRERRLRKNVPKHMFVLLAGLRYIKGIGP